MNAKQRFADSFAREHASARRVLHSLPESKSEFKPHDEMVQFIRGPQRVEAIPVMELIWFMLMDQVHHRGQFSVYLRASGEKVPSIYGPTAHEPWM